MFKIFHFLFTQQFYCVHIWFLIILCVLSVMQFCLDPGRTYVPAAPKKEKLRKGWKAMIAWGIALIVLGVVGALLKNRGVTALSAFNAHRYFNSYGFFEHFHKYKDITLGMMAHYNLTLCLYGLAVLAFAAVFCRLERRLKTPEPGCGRNSPRLFLLLTRIVAAFLPLVVTVFLNDALVHWLIGLNDASKYIQERGNVFQVATSDAYYFQSVSIYLCSYAWFSWCYALWRRVIEARNHAVNRVAVAALTFPVCTIMALVFTRLTYGVVSIFIPIAVALSMAVILGSGRPMTPEEKEEAKDPYSKYLWDQYKYSASYESRIDKLKDMSQNDILALSLYAFDYGEDTDLLDLARDVKDAHKDW